MKVVASLELVLWSHTFVCFVRYSSSGRGRIYVPLEDLERFKITEAEVMNGTLVDEEGKVDSRWKEFMKFQIKRARFYFAVSSRQHDSRINNPFSTFGGER